MEGIASLLRPKVVISGDTLQVSDQSVSKPNFTGISNLGNLGYLGAVPTDGGHGSCLKCHEIYELLHRHILECHTGGNEKDSNSILNNVLMNILMLLTSSSKSPNHSVNEPATFDSSMPAGLGGASGLANSSGLGNSSANFTIVASTNQSLAKPVSANIEPQSSANHNMSNDGLVSAISLQKLLSSAQANHSKVFAEGATENERRKTVVQGIPLITTDIAAQGNVPLVLGSQFQEVTRQPTIVVPSAVPKVSEKSDLDVADILVNKMPIPSVNKEESSLAQLYLKQLAEGLASGRSDILQQADTVAQASTNERDLVNALLNGNINPATSIPATIPSSEGGSKPVVETISQILAAQRQLTSLLSLLGKRQNEPTLLPVAGLASQLVETPLNNPLFANQQQKVGSAGLLQIPLSSILPGLTQTSQGLLPTNLIQQTQGLNENNIYPHVANVQAKKTQVMQGISGTGAVALPALALNTSVFQNTAVPVLQQTIQGALRSSGQQTVILPSVVPGSITSVSTSALLGTQSGLQSFLLPSRPMTQIVTQASTATTKTLFTTISQPNVPSLAEQLFQNTNNIPKLALSTVPSIFNLGNMPGMAILNASQQRQTRPQSQPTIRQIPILPTSSVIVPSSSPIVPSVDKLQGLISAALQNPSKGTTILNSTAVTSDDMNVVFGKHRLSSGSTETKDVTVDDDSQSVPKKLYKCGSCGTTFSVLSTLQQHEQTHLGTKIQCNYCQDIFTDVGKYQEHISLHRGEENVHQCEYCNKLFTSRGELQKHLAEHTQKRPYKCKHCSKSFRDPGSLQKHERIHTGERPYKCQHCTRAFAEYSSLRKHNRVHTGEKPYKCPRCPKAFSISGNLQRHMYIHTGERPYRCTKCPKAFNNPSHLRRHVKNLHENKRASSSKDTDSVIDSDSEMVDDDFCSMAKA